MKRRDFITLLVAAPAIVQAQNIMPIWVPSTKVIVPDHLGNLALLLGILRMPLESDESLNSRMSVVYHRTNEKVLQDIYSLCGVKV